MQFWAFIVSFFVWTVAGHAAEFGPQIIISEKDQKLALINASKVEARYAISTSKFGLGDSFGSYKTPVGALFVCRKFGEGLPLGAVIKHRMATGEILKANAAGRDPITSRIIWLRGLESCNQNAYDRCIYIHGTPEERKLGKKASYGCIRMRSKDVIDLYGRVQVGTRVTISTEPLSKLLPKEEESVLASFEHLRSPAQSDL